MKAGAKWRKKNTLEQVTRNRMQLSGNTEQLSDWENAKLWLSDPRVTMMSAKVS